MENKHPKVFISYSHEDDIFEKKMVEFANKLRSEGIDANIDLFNPVPKEGWPRWMENQMIHADYVIVVCSESYYNKFYKKEGKGVTWEVNLVYQMLYDEHCLTKKFIPVYWNVDDEKYVLNPLKPYTHYNVGTEEGFEGLRCHILDIAKYKKAELGTIDLNRREPLPEKKQKTMFFSTPIDIEKWDDARWKGVVYLISPEHGIPPVVGFLYRNYEAAKQIFKEWQEKYEGAVPDDYIKITYIVPPLPKDCYVNSDPERNNGKGYFVYIGVNEDKAIERAMDVGIKTEDLLFTFISRYIWVDEINGSVFRETFFKQAKECGCYLIIPVGMIDENKGFSQENLIIENDKYGIEMKNVFFKRGIDIKENDPCKVVLQSAGQSK